MILVVFFYNNGPTVLCFSDYGMTYNAHFYTDLSGKYVSSVCPIHIKVKVNIHMKPDDATERI